MCIALFMWQAHPRYPFVLLFNRDEYYSRPTKAVEWWEDGQIVGGRDELAGGTWLASSRAGRLAFITNVRENESLSQPKSTGHLPLRFLQSKKNINEFAEEVNQEAEQYNGFNLILTDLCSNSMLYITNRPREVRRPSTLQVSPGIHVLTNASLDAPWPSALRLEQNFRQLIKTHGEDEICASEMIKKLMMDKTKSDKNSLPGIWDEEFEYQLSSICVDTDSPLGRCGTRSSCAVLLDVHGEVCFHEHYLDESFWKDHEIVYQIQ